MPDIDLNFAAEYQREIHKYVKELFGKDRVFCAGTVYVKEENIAEEIVQKYFNNKNMIPYPPIFNCLVNDIQWMKRTTGQAPGSLMIVPSDKEIYDFTPIQYHGDEKSSGVLTTHFKHFYLTDTLLKLDLLGHDAPTRLKKLEDLTGVSAKDISLDDEETLNLLINADTIGVPEFGTDSVRNMIKIANPKTFDDLVKISGLLHGTDVWKDNAENLINSGTATISEVIALRDEIMMYLIDKDIDRETAYVIMDRVRRGKGLTNEHAGIMRAAKVPDWYIDSCNKIQYMFPKAHTVGYTIMAFRIAWFKAHHLETFYKAVFEMHNDFDVDFMSLDISETKKQLEEIKVKRDSLPYDYDDNYVDYLYCEDMYNLLQVRLEMLEINSFCDL